MKAIEIEFLFNFLLLIWCFYNIFKIKKNSSKLNLASFSVVILSFFYGITPIYTYFQGRIEQHYSIDILIDNYLIIFFFIAGISIINIFLFKPNSNRDEINPIIKIFHQVDRISSSYIISFYFFFFGIGFILKNIYGFNYYGSGTLEKHTALPYEFFAFIQISEIFIFSILVWVIREIILKNNKNIYNWIILGTYIFANFHSRSTILWLFLIALFILLLYNINLNYKTLFLLSGTLYMLFVFILPVIVGFRNLQKKIAEKGDEKNAVEINIEAFNETLETDVSSYNEISASNIKDRLYFYDVNMYIIENIGSEFMYGDLFINSFYKIIPRFLNPNKFNEYGGFTSESLIVDHYNFYLHHDISDNLPIYGYIDFGFLGSFLIGSFLGYLLYMITNISYKYREKLSFYSFCIFIGGFKLSMSFEAHYIGVFTTLRNLILVFILGYILKVLYTFIFPPRKKISENPAYNTIL